MQSYFSLLGEEERALLMRLYLGLEACRVGCRWRLDDIRLCFQDPDSDGQVIIAAVVTIALLSPVFFWGMDREREGCCGQLDAPLK